MSGPQMTQEQFIQMLKQRYLQMQAQQQQQQQQGMSPVSLAMNLYGKYKAGRKLYDVGKDAYNYFYPSEGGTSEAVAAASPRAPWAADMMPGMEAPGAEVIDFSVAPGEPGYEQAIAYLDGAGPNPYASMPGYGGELASYGGSGLASGGADVLGMGGSGLASGTQGFATADAAIAAGYTPVATDAATGLVTGVSDAAAGGMSTAVEGGVSGTGSTLAAASPYLGAAGLGLGAYGIYNATQMDDKGKAALAGGLSGAGAGMGGAMLALGAANMWNPVGWGLMLGGAGLGAGLGGMFAHKSTKQRQAERWQDLYGQDYTGQQDFINWQEGEKGNIKEWQEQQKALGAGNWDLDPTQEGAYQVSIQGKPVTVVPETVWGEVAPQDLVGNDYFGKWNEQQRYEFNKRALEQGLYEHRKGGFEFRDKDAAAALVQEIGSGTGWDEAWRAPTQRKVLDDPSTPGYNEAEMAYSRSGGSQAPASTPQAPKAPARGEGPAPLDWQTIGGQAGEAIIEPILGYPGLETYPGTKPNTTPWLEAEREMWQNMNPSQGWAPGIALTEAGSTPTDWEEKLRSGEYRRGSKAAGGYVNNQTNEWVAG